MKIPERVFLAAQLELRASKVDGKEALPDGVCGRLTGVALVYNQPDDYGTIFVPGCLSKTRAERVNAGKVKLFADHGPFTHTHVGVVRSMEDVGDGVVMTADLFDTEAGRAMKEYLEAVLASGGDTGLSIGFRPHAKEWRELDDAMAAKAGLSPADRRDLFCFFKEIELREVSVTPVPAVPGAEVVSVRREPAEEDEGLIRRHLAHILRSLPERDARAVFDEVYASSAASPDTGAAPAQPPAETSTPDAGAGAESATDVSESSTGPKLATSDERIAAVRGTYARTPTTT